MGRWQGGKNHHRWSPSRPLKSDGGRKKWQEREQEWQEITKRGVG